MFYWFIVYSLRAKQCAGTGSEMGMCDRSLLGKLWQTFFHFTKYTVRVFLWTFLDFILKLLGHFAPFCQPEGWQKQELERT